MRSGIGPADRPSGGRDRGPPRPAGRGRQLARPSGRRRRHRLRGSVAGRAAAPLDRDVPQPRGADRRLDDLMLWLADPAGPDSPPPMTIDAVLLQPDARGNVRTPVRRSRRSATNRPAGPDARATSTVWPRPWIARSMSWPTLRCEPCAPVPRRHDPRRAEQLRAHIAENSYSIPMSSGPARWARRRRTAPSSTRSGRVHGVDGLFVADASIIPEPPSGFRHLPTLMVAERLSEVVAAVR